MGRRWLRVLLAAVGVAAAAAAYRAGSRAWVRAELARADREIAAGEFDPARDRLTRLSRFAPGGSAALYNLGLCERAAGRPLQALAAWSRIDDQSPDAARAAGARDELLRSLLDAGRFGELEASLIEASRGPGTGPAVARQALVNLLRFQGRFDEVRDLLIEDFDRAADASKVLRDLWMLDAEPVPVEMVGGVLRRAAARSPDDDRVWLGLANLATWSGRFDDADRLIRDCLERRPDDPSVWRASLRLARASGRPDAAARALAKLPAGRIDAAEAWEWAAWFARQAGNREAERRALERLLDEVPGDGRSLDRLAAIAADEGDRDRVSALRRRKDYIDRSADLYRSTLAPDARTIDLPTAGRLAESLGRWFEAKGWWSLVERLSPGNTEAREALGRLAARPAPSPPEALPAPERAPAGPPTTAEAPVPPAFIDAAVSAGLAFVYESGRSPARHLVETMGGGVGLIDFDGDGLLDVYAVQGGPSLLPDRPSADRLFRNRGDGTFEDVSRAAGVSSFPGGHGQGVAVGDYDNDGYSDLFITRYQSYALYRNRGDGTFEDATADAGFGGDRDWPTSAAWADLDDDGDLDLYVCHYVAYDPNRPPDCGGKAGAEYCDPRKFAATPDHLFRNDGGRFTDVTAGAGIVDRDGRGLGVVAADLDGDSRVDLYVANDTTANFFFRNLGGLRFEEIGVSAGVAAGASGGFQAGMGVACGDIDGDGLPDLAVTNFYGESTSLYRNLGGGDFADQTAGSGLAALSRPLLGFGAAFLDYNNDGFLDLATANGHVNDYRPNVPYAMPPQILTGLGGGRLADLSGEPSPPWATPRIGRGLASGDLDNDGRVDLVLVAQDGPLVFLRNETPGGHSLTIALEGVDSNRDGVGARLTVTSGSVRRVAVRYGGGSYLSAGDRRLHFGLGISETAEVVEVTWPGGRVDRHEGLRAGSGYLLREGHGTPTPLPGFNRTGDHDPVVR